MKDSIRIQAGCKDTVYLTIGNDQNKKVALYNYLDILGYRFYGPEDHWTYIPELENHSLIDTTIYSLFQLRRFAPSYSVGPPTNEGLKNAGYTYDRWMNRLRMANVLQLRFGHYGSTFNRKYKEEIIAHPEWRGKNKDGKIRSWSSNLKLCYSHPGVIELYEKDAKIRLEKIMKTQSPPYYINMEPPDGGGHCQCTDCSANKTPSDLVFGLANKIAEFLRSINPDAGVWLIAYNKHAAPPSFSLNDNLLVGLVPYAFQRDYTPDKFMQVWEEFHNHLFLRDYLAIPQSNLDAPYWQNGDEFLNRIQHIKTQNYSGYNFETTASFLSAGWPTYLISTASWKNLNYKASLDQFKQHMFASSNLNLKELINYFEDARSSSYYYGNLENQINNALLICSDSLEMKRLKDIEKYFHYLAIRHTYTSNRDQEKHIMKDNLLNFIYSDSSGLLLHSWGLYRVMVKDRNNIKFGQQIKKGQASPIPNFTLRSRKPTVLGYKAIHPNFHSEIIDTMPIIKFNNNPNSLVFIPDSSDLTIKIRVKNVPSNRHGGGNVVLFDLEGNEINSKIFDYENIEWNNISFTVPKANAFYIIKFNNPAAIMYIQGPNRPFAFTDPLATGVLPQPIKLWAYNPKNYSLDMRFTYLTRQVVIDKEDMQKEKFYVKDPVSRTITGNGVFSIQTTKASFEVLNIPHLFSPLKQQVILPILE
ncbi:DUF4838 domain-containing protein [Membranicola marinus]|uniref:DUF4838 domain-containing protein n=1 Tax=Membranihabitans marinus TaxID=1227546 RepID=A0A953L5I0_9BACT|nr:DUF4838 domain-containing protein [Membranihabitans marinus]MBY5956607.1 DUF4838 domain-containing protein [Membranihabitans marinus]